MNIGMARLSIFAILIAWTIATYLSSTWDSIQAETQADRPTFVSTNYTCNIKGNISLNTGERIYHVPGQEHYSETIITPSKGERWFCSEDKARAAGWRKARR
ncbi:MULTISPECIES: hypothetical protein [unclassified Nitrobacter]|uniref:sunset domain-containing protein n=1 Tax=unclassified Nitrobacter TaxID=2620411 RepID=UPI000ADEC29D|nr:MULTISPECIES: hypothetical protein [unclassified Nitrobacter]MBN9147196.1 hypothetical protein [Nitrobacter sp.]